MSVILSSMPDDWKHSIEVISSPGRDDWGDPMEGSSKVIEGCLLAISETSDLDNMNSNPTLRAKLMIPSGHSITSTSQIKTFAPAAVVGKWAIDGEPIHWPLGTEVRLEWEGRSDG